MSGITLDKFTSANAASGAIDIPARLGSPSLHQPTHYAEAKLTAAHVLCHCRTKRKDRDSARPGQTNGYRDSNSVLDTLEGQSVIARCGCKNPEPV